MARTGITKKMVNKAIKQLASANTTVTIDAVRAELGHTGSKTTICRFMNEIDQEQTVKEDKLALLSESMVTLVANIAKRLYDDIQSPLTEAQAQLVAVQKDWQNKVDELNRRLDEEQTATCAIQSDRDQLINDIEKRNKQLTDSELLHATQCEKIRSLSQQVATQKEHLVSLEDKHAQSRDALNHFRVSAKEQREQEARRHSDQIQLLQKELRQAQQTSAIKQDQLTQLGKSNVRLESDLSHAQATLVVTSTELTSLREANLVEIETRKSIQLSLDGALTLNDTQENDQEKLFKQLKKLEKECHALNKRNIQLSSELATKEKLIQQWLASTSFEQPKKADLS